jgi:DNA-binding response OmpR family regulator
MMKLHWLRRMARFVVVEDYPPLASAIRLAIVRQGHTVFQAHSVQATLDLKGYFDHAVLDIDLPDGNGVELAEELITQQRVGSVVFFTASRERDLLERAAKCGLVVDKAAGCDCLLSVIAQLRQPGAYRVAAVAGAPDAVVGEGTNRSGLRRKVDGPR